MILSSQVVMKMKERLEKELMSELTQRIQDKWNTS